MSTQTIKRKIMEDYAKCHNLYFRKTGKSSMPRKVYRQLTEIPQTQMTRYFGEYKNLRREATKKLNLSTREDTEINGKISSSIKGSIQQRFIVSSVVEGAPIDQNLFAAMKLYCEKNNARLLLFWMKGVYKTDHFTQEEIAQLEPYLITSFKFNKNLEAHDFLLHPTQMLPLTGLDRFGSKKTSLIVASTKQMMTSIPRPKNEVPHIIWSTGTISVPKYSKTRVGSLATQDNQLSGLIVEIESEDRFYIRNVEWIKDCFVDLGKAYYKDNVKKIDCEGIVLGDMHLTEECQNAVTRSIEQINDLKAKKVIIHDLISLNSISHHNFGKYLTKTFIPNQFDTLEKELDYAKVTLNNFLSQIKADAYIVQSNHDDFLYKYCDAGEFIKDTPNAILGAKCFIKYQSGINPIEDYLRSKATFLKRDESFKIKNIEVGQHGHNGANGAKGSPNSFKKSFDKIIVGHSHSPKILNGVYYVGTLSKLTLNYNKGSSSWLHANAPIYANGSRQLILWIDNKYKM